MTPAHDVRDHGDDHLLRLEQRLSMTDEMDQSALVLIVHSGVRDREGPSHRGCGRHMASA